MVAVAAVPTNAGTWQIRSLTAAIHCPVRDFALNDTYRPCWLLGTLLCAVVLGSFYVSTPSLPLVSNEPIAAWRWWEETVTWVKSLGWDRGRLVQLWFLFVLIGLYIILRIKPRA